MSDMQEVKYTGGIGWFFFALIPGAIAGALLMYLAFFTGWIDWQQAQNAKLRQQRVEGRMDNRVGVNGELTKPVDLVIKGNGCFKITRAYMDGSTGNEYEGPSNTLTAYMTNKCHSDVSFFHFYWTAAAPDGTIINSGYENNINGNSEVAAGETIEIQEKIGNDDRTAKVTVWAKNNSN